MHQALTKRTVFVAGKGGVGRTTLATALALAASNQGKRVLVAEIGVPEVDFSPLGHLFGRDTLPDVPIPLAPDVFGVVLASRTGHEAFLRSVLPVPVLVRAALQSKPLRRFFSATPSLNELGVFYHLLVLAKQLNHQKKPAFDQIIIDLPATGHALALAQLPEQLLRIIPRGPIAMAMREGTQRFFDAEYAALWVATLPEALPVSECLELVQALQDTSMPLGGVLVNKVPNQRFSKAERQLLDAMVQQHAVFGTTQYQGLVHMQAALHRLATSTELPLCQVPTRTEDGLALARALAEHMMRMECT